MIYIKNRTKIIRLGWLTLGLIYLFSCPILINTLVKAWEEPVIDLKSLNNHEVGVLLTGGIIEAHISFNENLHLGGSGDRLWQTLHLYKESKINKIIISGGDISLINHQEQTEIDLAYLFLLKNGVIPADIILEKKGRNTNENAIYTAKILNDQFYGESVLLVTSSFHMKRAKACFEKRNINVNTFPSNFLSNNAAIDLIDFIPSPTSFYISNIYFKEVLGFGIYKIMGYA